jgi:hypothetical protein
MTYTTTHLAALQTRLSTETVRHSDNPNMQAYLAGIRKEIKQEEKFLADRGVNTYSNDDCDLSIDELLEALEV